MTAGKMIVIAAAGGVLVLGIALAVSQAGKDRLQDGRHRPDQVDGRGPGAFPLLLGLELPGEVQVVAPGL